MRFFFGKSKFKRRVERDNIYASLACPQPFTFNHDVARVFDDMVSRSVPLYKETLYSVAEWARRYYQSGSIIYDVGCSTGTTIDILACALDEPAHFVGIDTSDAMLDQASEKLSWIKKDHQLNLICNNALDMSYRDASMVIMNYTLQFLPVADRLVLLKNIYKNMRPNGLLYISEKLKFSDKNVHSCVTEIYETFKESNGYSKSEIARKKAALDNVLIPLTFEEQKAMLIEAGFSIVDPIMQWNNFCSFIAIKE